MASLSQEQQKKRAKDLLREVREENPDALQRLQRWYSGTRSVPLRLHDAQTVIARQAILQGQPTVLLLQKADWLELNCITCWVGGVQIDSRAASHWRQEQSQGVLLRQFHQCT